MNKYEINLKRCPFCGGEAEFLHVFPPSPYRKRPHSVVQCSRCRCNSGERVKDKDAIEAWNRRPEQNIGKWILSTCLDDGFWVCSACGFVSEASGANILYHYCPRCGTPMEENNAID